MASESSTSPKAYSNATTTPESAPEQYLPNTPEHIAAHIKALSRSTLAAANARDLSPDSPGWNHVIADERYRIDGKPANLSDHLAYLESVTTEYPDFHLELLSQDAVVAKSGASAELFEVFEMAHGNGMITHQAMATHWELRGDRWWCINCSTTRGMVFD